MTFNWWFIHFVKLSTALSGVRSMEGRDRFCNSSDEVLLPVEGTNGLPQSPFMGGVHKTVPPGSFRVLAFSNAKDTHLERAKLDVFVSSKVTFFLFILFLTQIDFPKIFSFNRTFQFPSKDNKSLGLCLPPFTCHWQPWRWNLWSLNLESYRTPCMPTASFFQVYW